MPGCCPCLKKDPKTKYMPMVDAIVAPSGELTDDHEEELDSLLTFAEMNPPVFTQALRIPPNAVSSRSTSLLLILQ